MTALDVYVLRGEDGWGIHPGSAIVGSVEGERVRIDYEGDLYGRPALAGYATRLLHAAGRHIERYPTVARAWVPPGALRCIGRYRVEDEFFDLVDEAALCAWLGTDALAPEDRVAPTRRRAEREAILTGLQGENRVSVAVWAARRGHADLIPRELRAVARHITRG